MPTIRGAAIRGAALCGLLACDNAAGTSEDTDTGREAGGTSACERLASLAQSRGCALDAECAVVSACDALAQSWIDCLAQTPDQCGCEPGDPLRCESSSGTDAGTVRCAAEVEAFRSCQEREHPETADPAAARVGDPCIPENVPPSGFSDSEAYVEPASSQCGGSACLVFRLLGDPRAGCVATPDAPCAAPEEAAARVYCTCLCNGDDSPTCACPDGFACVATVDAADGGLPSSHCVMNGTF
jgi:hypothetical protein